jgi:hypothetical protein
MSAKVVIVHSNPQPNRERRYPSTWLVYSKGRSIRCTYGTTGITDLTLLYKAAA